MVIGKSTPNYRHSSQSAAEKEAERLAKINPGEEFIILKALKKVVVQSVHWADLEEIPF